MSYAANPSIVRNGLVLCHDAASPLSYSSAENLIHYSNYNATPWVLPNANATLTTGIDAPDGTMTAVRMAGSNVGNTLWRINHPSVTANGTDAYTVSFYVRLISGSSSTNGQLTFDWNDNAPALDYRPLLVANRWVRVSATSVPAAGTKTFLDLLSDCTHNFVIDYWGVQIEKGLTATTLTPTVNTTYTRGTSITSIASTTNNGTINGDVTYSSNGSGAWVLGGTSSYISVPAGNANFTGGFTVEFAGAMDLSTSSYQRFIDFGNGAGVNNIVIYRYGAGTQIGMDVYGATFRQMFSTNGALVSNQNAIWHFVCDGSFGRIYKNGILDSAAIMDNVPSNITRNNCYIGRSNWAGDPYFKGNIYTVKMYNRALTPAEVSQNVAAIRGRLGV